MTEPTIEQVAKARLMYLQYEARGEGVYLVAKLLAERDHARELLEVPDPRQPQQLPL